MLNGRFDHMLDGFTSVSTRGTAVVDYIVTRVEDMNKVKSFNVEICSQISNTDKIDPW